MVTGRNAERGEAVAREIAALGCDARFVAGDLACLDDCRNLVAAADRAFGTLHVLVNAGALTERATIWDTTPEFYERIMSINVRAPFFLTQAAVGVMRREGRGRLHRQRVERGLVTAASPCCARTRSPRRR